MPILFEREGRRMETTLDVSPLHPLRERQGLAIGISLSVIGTVILLRAPPGRRALLLYLVMNGYALNQMWYPGGPAGFTYGWIATFALGEMVFAPVLLLTDLLWFDRRLPRWLLALPWLLALKGPLRLESLHEVWLPAAPALKAFIGLDAAMNLGALVLAVWNYRVADALERRKMRWILYGVVAGLLPVLAINRVADAIAAELLRFDLTEIVRQTRQMQESLRRYVPGAVADRLASGQTLEASEREVPVLFVDIRGYTSLSRDLAAPDVFATVNRYTETVSSIVRAHAGSVVEFNGDGMMAVFGAPSDLPHRERCAVNAAREIVLRVAKLEAPTGSRGKLSCGVGVATGPAFVGDIRAGLRAVTALAARPECSSRAPPWWTSPWPRRSWACSPSPPRRRRRRIWRVRRPPGQLCQNGPRCCGVSTASIGWPCGCSCRCGSRASR